MSTFTAKHKVEEINGIRCSIVESDVSAKRLEFLTALLKKNNYEVVSEKLEDDKFKVGVNDLFFNPVIDVYKRRLKTLDDKVVSHQYWFQMVE